MNNYFKNILNDHINLFNTFLDFEKNINDISEIIYKCWNNLGLNVKRNIFFISNYELLKQQFSILKYRIKFSIIKILG